MAVVKINAITVPEDSDAGIRRPDARPAVGVLHADHTIAPVWHRGARHDPRCFAGFQAPAGTAARGDVVDHAQCHGDSPRYVRGPNGEAVHCAVVPGRQVHLGNDVPGQDAAARVGKRAPFGVQTVDSRHDGFQRHGSRQPVGISISGHGR